MLGEAVQQGEGAVPVAAAADDLLEQPACLVPIARAGGAASLVHPRVELAFLFGGGSARLLEALPGRRVVWVVEENPAEGVSRFPALALPQEIPPLGKQASDPVVGGSSQVPAALRLFAPIMEESVSAFQDRIPRRPSPLSGPG